MRRRLLMIDTGRQSWRLETLRVETLAHDEREEYLTLHGEALCQYLLRTDLGRRDASALIVARGPMAFLAGNKATVGYLSPLTGLPHYSFVGGQAAAQLVNLGLDAILLLGGGQQDHYLVISGRAPDLAVQFKAAAGLPEGQRAAFYHLLEAELAGNGGAGSVFTLGEGARHGYRAANVAVEGIYHAGRGGAGAALARLARAIVLRGDPLEQGQFFDRLSPTGIPAAGTDVSFRKSPNRSISDLLAPHTARLSSRTGGTIAKLYTTGCIEQDGQTLPARNATQIGYEMAILGDKRVLAATRDGQTGCHWCPVDCRHWHWAPADYAPGGRDRLLDDFEPAYAVLAMLGLLPDDASFKGQLAFLQEVDRRLFVPIEQLGCDVIDVGVGLAALFEGLERGIVPQEDVPAELRGAQLGDLELAVAAVALLREGIEGGPYPALRAIGDGPQALVGLYPEMADLVFTCGQGTLGNAGHCNALWTFLMPFSRFFGHYSGQIYKIDEALPAPPATDEALRRVFRRVIERMFNREFFGILCNALSCCAFTFSLYSQGGEGERLDDGDLLVRTLAQYGIQTTREDLIWFAQAFWAQSIDLKRAYGWRPPRAADLPRRVYEGLSRVLGQPPEELQRWMDLLIAEWKGLAREMLGRYGYDAAWLG